MAETNDRARAGLLAKTALSVTLTVAMAFGSIPTPALSKMAEQSGLAADADASAQEHPDDADDQAQADGASAKEEKSVGGYDEMLPQAVEVVLETKSCSVSMLQRRIKLGYSRAARIVDQMEELGVVGPYEGAKPRSVVVDREGWNEIARSLGLIEGDDMALAAQMNEDGDSLDYDN